jgi:hypothetical protein
VDIGVVGVGFMEGVRGDLTSTLTGGKLKSDTPQLKQYLASSELALPQT